MPYSLTTGEKSRFVSSLLSVTGSTHTVPPSLTKYSSLNKADLYQVGRRLTETSTHIHLHSYDSETKPVPYLSIAVLRSFLIE